MGNLFQRMVAQHLDLSAESAELVRSLEGRLMAQDRAIASITFLCEECREHNHFHFTHGNPVLLGLSKELPRVRESLNELTGTITHIAHGVTDDSIVAEASSGAGARGKSGGGPLQNADLPRATKMSGEDMLQLDAVQEEDLLLL